jgi:lipoprotein-releasing system ATP-binding protein
MVSDMSELVLAGSDLVKEFVQGQTVLTVLRGAAIEVRRGERIAIVGASGSGKTTLLQVLGGLDLPTRGTISIAGERMDQLSDAQRGALRNRAVGFVYQFHHLLPEFSALENVAMPLLVRRVGVSEARDQAAALLARVGLAERLSHRPAQLSGGERQRAAVARALVTRPALILADEPTGNLDAQTGALVLDLLTELSREHRQTLILVTHSLAVARAAERIVTLDQGRLHAGGAELTW